MDILTLRALEDEDIPLLEAWLQKPYIKKYYANAEAWLTEVRQRRDKYSYIRHFMAIYGDNAIGFCQYYDCISADEDWYGEADLTATYSIDYMIGDEEYLRKGFGKAVVGLVCQTAKFKSGAKRIIVMPDSDNLPSINSLLANDFVMDIKYGFYCKELI